MTKHGYEVGDLLELKNVGAMDQARSFGMEIKEHYKVLQVIDSVSIVLDASHSSGCTWQAACGISLEWFQKYELPVADNLPPPILKLSRTACD